MPEWEPEVTVDEAQARALIAAQFPQLDSSELYQLGEGWDNTVWMTPERVVFRFPRRAIAVAGALRGLIDWGAVCRADPAADLSLYWSALDPPAREAFLAVYGPIDDASLLRARVLALFLCAVLADYARDTAKPELQREMLCSADSTEPRRTSA